jgi:ubiquinone biosynthesis protein UbiJ
VAAPRPAFTVFDALASAPLNHLLRVSPWAREALKPHAGKVACLRCLPFETRLAVLDQGEVAAAPANAAAALTLTVTPGLMLRIAAGDDKAWRDIGVDGDTALAGVIQRLWRELRWDVEEDLSKVVGDIAARRIAQSGRALQQWAAAGVDNLARSAAEYWTEEQPLIAGKDALAQFAADVDRLRDDVARLEKRIARLAAH